MGLRVGAVREVGRDGTAASLAAEAVRTGVRRVLAAGGDGTLHEVIQVLAGTRTALGIVPLGTSNDLAGRLGIPQQLDEALDDLAQYQTVSVDLLRIGNDRVTSVGGFGLPAHVARECNEIRAHPLVGKLASALGGQIYSVGAAARIARVGAQSLRYELTLGNGAPIVRRASAILVGVTGRFGGGMELAPNGLVQPGTFAALVVTASSRAGLLGTLLRLKSGRSVDGVAERYTGLERMMIRTDSLVGTFGDGEWLGLRHRATIQLERGALRVLVPPKAAAQFHDADRFREAM
jgi:diacylglycerol kinase (ATP)